VSASEETSDGSGQSPVASKDPGDPVREKRALILQSASHAKRARCLLKETRADLFVASSHRARASETEIRSTDAVGTASDAQKSASDGLSTRHVIEERTTVGE
jgi:hypothetical protein